LARGITMSDAQTGSMEAAGSRLIDTAPAWEIAARMNLDEARVEAVLEEFKELFRKSNEPQSRDRQSRGLVHDYSLVLRYSRRLYKNNNPVAQQTEFGEVWTLPLNHQELFGLLGFITDRVRDEQERQRTAQSNRTVMVAALLAAFASMTSVLINLLK
jgi:hypothetical protein